VKQYFSLYNVILALFFLFIVFPVLFTFISALFFNTSFSDDISSLNISTISLLFKSVFLAGIIALLSSIIGTVLAFILFKTELKHANIYKIILLTPLFISPYILAVAWKDLFFMLFQNNSFLSSYIGVTIVITTVYTPLSMLIVGSSLTNINSKIEESALMLTSTKNLIFKIILPLIKPALLSSFVLIFIFSISNFAVPAFFGIKVFTTEIFTQFSAFYRHSFAIIQSVALLIICVLLLMSEHRFISEATFFSFGGKGISSRVYTKGKAIHLLALNLWIIISIALPLLMLIIQSFSEDKTFFTQAFTLLLPTFSTSILLSLLASLLIVIIGFTVAYFGEWKNRNTSFFNWMLLIIFTIPSTVFGISLIKFYNQESLNFIYSTYAILIIAYVGKFSFISTKIISNAIKQIPKSISETAIIQGIKTSSIIRRILIPLIFPSILTSFVISFIFTIGELGTTIMIYPPGTELMPIKIFTIMANAPQALTSSMNLIVFLLTLVSILVFSLFFKLLNNVNN
jgi:ABC-type Fe3+ transport system permease subunit